MFNIFPKKKSVDEILEDVTLSTMSWNTDTQIPSYVQAQDEMIGELLKDKKNLEDILKSIEEDGTTEHNNAIKLREENAKLNLHITALHKIIEGSKQTIDNLKKDLENQQQLKDSLQRVNEKYIKRIIEQGDKIILLENAIERWHSRANEWEKMDEEIQSAVSELTKEVIGLRHLKTENVELIERINAANKEIEALKKEKKESFDILKEAIENESKRFHKLVAKHVPTEINLEAANKEIEALRCKLRDYQDKYAESFSCNDMNGLQKEIDELTLMYKEREAKLKSYNSTLLCQITSLKEENDKLKKDETQKHPMYPLHWGGYDKNIIDFVESEFNNEDPVEGKQVEFNSEELLKRITEYADTLDSLPKSFPDEFQDNKVIDWMSDEGVPNDREDGETTADNLEERFDTGKNVLDYFGEWKCPCNKCKEAKTEKSWEEAASDLALKVTKLERIVENQMLQIEELKVVGVNLNNRVLDANYEHFKKYGKWPW